jgi:hypothetical protein
MGSVGLARISSRLDAVQSWLNALLKEVANQAREGSLDCTDNNEQQQKQILK